MNIKSKRLPDKTWESEEEMEKETIPVKGKILGRFEIRVSHQIAEVLRKNPELLEEFKNLIEKELQGNEKR